jgi:hypothetical protein
MFGFLILLAVLWILALPQPVLAQTDGTAVPPIILNEPTLTPPIGAGQFPNGWLKIAGKSPQIIYLTANGTAVDGIEGTWPPDLPQAGRFQVELYVGVSEFREYALLAPEQLAGLDQLTHSAQYTITHADGLTTIVVDQDRRESGWVDLGVYGFTGGGGEGVTLSNVTDEAAGTAVLTAGAARFTYVGDNTPSTATPTATPLPPTQAPPTAAAATAVPPTATGEPLFLLDFGEPAFGSSDSGERDEVNIPLIVGGEPVGRMTISYPTAMGSTQADNIQANIIVENEFADALKVALEDETANEILGELIVRSQFYLTLDAASFEFDDTFKTQRLTVFQGQPAGVAWNIKPQAGISGRQQFNIKVILRFTDGIPEVSGPPPAFTINVLRDDVSPPPSPAPTSTAAPTPAPTGRILDNLIDNTAVLIGVCLSFIVGILGVGIAYLNYRKGKEAPPLSDAPAILDSERQLQLHRWLDDYFNEQELRSLCLEIGVDYDDLPFSGQSAKARELVGWCARNGRLDTLETVIRQHRPNL